MCSSNLLDPYLLSSLNGVASRRTQYRQLLATAQSLYQLLQPDGTEPALSDTIGESGLQIINARIARTWHAGHGLYAEPAFATSSSSGKPKRSDVFRDGN